MAATYKLSQLLSRLGYGSRREVEGLIYSDRVTLAGAPIADAGMAITPQHHALLQVDGTPADPLPGMVVMLHKPLGVTCSHKEAGALVYDLLPARWRRRDPQLSTIGRLDKETSGLLLLTDDGALLHKIISPRQHIAKRYRARLARPLLGHEAALFASGTLMLEGEQKPLLPAALEIVSPQEALLTLHEGRYHQVRRMFAAAGNHVEALHREQLGGLALPATLAAGAYLILSAEEIAAIFVRAA